MKTTKEMIVVMTAFENGEEIEYCPNHRKGTYSWNRVEIPLWNWLDYDYRVKEEDKYIDMGLPSGNLWNANNEEGFFTCDDLESFGDKVPSINDFKELLEHCYHKWNDKKKGIEFLSKNGKTLFFPADGLCFNNSVNDSEICGYYLSSTFVGDNNVFTFNFSDVSAYMNNNNRKSSQSVRLIKRK